jgi:hypothetical protein
MLTAESRDLFRKIRDFAGGTEDRTPARIDAQEQWSPLDAAGRLL